MGLISTIRNFLFLEAVGSSHRSNLIIGAGVVSLIAERMLQRSLAHETTPQKLLASWACKVMPFVANASTGFTTKSNLIYAPLFLIIIYEGLESHRYFKNATVLFSFYLRSNLAFAIGYRMDRAIRLTEKTGPVMLISSLSLALLLGTNVWDDRQNLAERMKVFKESTGVKIYEDYKVSILGGSLVLIILHATRIALLSLCKESIVKK